MYTVLKSLLERPADEVRSLIEQVLDTDELVTMEEKEFFAFLQLTLAAGATPTEQLFLDHFPDSQVFLQDSRRLSVQDARAQFVCVHEERRRHQMASAIRRIAENVETNGLTDENSERLRKLRAKNSSSLNVPVPDDFCPLVQQSYLDRKTRSVGLATFIEVVDKATGGMNPGTLNTIMGFTGHFKTSLAVDIAYRNAFSRNFNIAFISLEMTRDELWMMFLSRHSADPKFDKFAFIPHERIRCGELSDEEEDYLFNVIAPDFDSLSTDDPGIKKGKIYIVEASDFRSRGIDDIYAKMEEIDEQCKKATGYPFDAFIWDHIQMFKFGSATAFPGQNEYSVMNAYANQIMNWAISFRGRPTIQVLLAQTNREGWKKAVRNGGVYEITALAEVERASTRVLSVYTDENLKASKEVKVQVLKSRYGPGLADPVTVFIEPACVLFGEDGPSWSCADISMDVLMSGVC